MGVYRHHRHIKPTGTEQWSVWYIDHDDPLPAADDDHPGELLAEGLADVYDACAVMAEHAEATTAATTGGA